MGEVLEPLLGGRDAHLLHQLEGGLHAVLAAHAAVHPEHLGDLEADRVDRVQGRERVLEDHGDLLAALVLHLALGQREQVGALQEHSATGDKAGRGVQDAHDGLRGDALAGAGLAQHGQGAAGLE